MKEATLLQTIVFDGFRADEIYPADLDGDGRMELLALQSPGIYQSDVFDATPWRLPDGEKRIFCLTALDRTGRVLWQRGTPYLASLRYGSHVVDQMAHARDGAIALLQGARLVLLDAASGVEQASTVLDHDNYSIVRPWSSRAGLRWVVKNTEAPYAGHWYGDPAHVFDATLRPLWSLPRTVGSGHSVRTFDVDGDGADELLIGYEAFDAGGRRLWRLEGRGEQGYDPILEHEDQFQIGPLEPGGAPCIAYAGSTDFHVGALDGALRWTCALGHPQHVLIGDFRGGGRTAPLAVLNIQVGPALRRHAAECGLALPAASYANGIVWLDAAGGIANVLYPGNAWPAHARREGGVHSGEGILVYPQGCADGSDAVIMRDAGWPRVYDLAGREPFALPYPGPHFEGGRDDAVATDGYGVRVVDFDGDGRAEILVHDRTTAWIFKPPYPVAAAPHTHGALQPVTGQGWYALDPPSAPSRDCHGTS